MSNLTESEILAALSNVSLSAQKRDKVAEALTDYITAQIDSELDRIRRESPGQQEPNAATEITPEEPAQSPPAVKPKKSQK